jgi:hypothetical protein
LQSPGRCGRWFYLIDPGTETLDFTDGLFYPAFLYVDGGNTAGTGTNLIEYRIDGFGTFFRTHVTFKMSALIECACYYYNSIGAGLKCFDQVRYIHLSGAGQADYFKLMIL